MNDFKGFSCSWQPYSFEEFYCTGCDMFWHDCTCGAMVSALEKFLTPAGVKKLVKCPEDFGLFKCYPVYKSIRSRRRWAPVRAAVQFVKKIFKPG